MIKKLILFYCAAAILGACTGFVASVFQMSIHKVDEALDILWHVAGQSEWYLGLLCVLVTTIMVVSVWLLVQYYSPQAAGSGVQEIEGALLHKRPMSWRSLLPIKFIGGVLAISSKMVLGREGPTIQIGGNLGAMFGELCRFPRRRIDTLIAAGAAAGLAAAFNAPLAGALFVMEEMRNQFNYSFTNMKMVVISCITATMVLHWLVGTQPSIQMAPSNLPSLASAWMFLIFGVVIGCVGLMFNQTLMWLLNHLDRLRFKERLCWVIVVSICIGYLAFAYSPSVGSGYLIISEALSMFPPFGILCLLILARFMTTMLSYSVGVPGGIFAPMLALGTLLGLAFFQVLHFFNLDLTIDPGMFAVAGMGALSAATVRAPITAAVLVMEMTQNYNLILPVMLTCIMATIVTQMARNKPIYTQLLNRSLLLGKHRNG